MLSNETMTNNDADVRASIKTLREDKERLVQERVKLVLQLDGLDAWFKENKIRKGSGGWRLNRERNENVKKKDEIIARAKEINLQIKVIDNNIIRLSEERTLSDKGADAVTDHAVVRWLERRHGIDVLKIREKIVREAMDGTISNKLNKKGSLYVENGDMVYVVNDKMNTVLTCFNREEWF